jgi:hypothetical protein
VSYTLISVLGANLRSGTLTVPNTQAAIPLDFSAQMLSEGVYYLLLSNDKGQARVKLIMNTSSSK